MSDRTHELRLAVPRDAYYLGIVRRAVVEVSRRAGFAVEDVGRIEMAVDEACANVVEHVPAPDGEGFDPVGALRVAARADECGIEVVIEYEGEPFAFESYGNIDLESYHEDGGGGGLGVYIMKRFMDEVRYSYAPGSGNALRLVKYR